MPNASLQETARAKAVQLHILKAGSEGELEAAFSSLVQLRAGALLVSPDAFFISLREHIGALASRHAVPTIYDWRECLGGRPYQPWNQPRGCPGPLTRSEPR
jgi:putative ABC transport system substrate-binding protein